MTEHDPNPGPCPGSGCYRGNRYGGRGRWLQEGDRSVLLPRGSCLATQRCSASILGPVLAGSSWSCRCLSHGSSAPLAFPFLKKPWAPGLDFPELVITVRAAGLDHLLGHNGAKARDADSPTPRPGASRSCSRAVTLGQAMSVGLFWDLLQETAWWGESSAALGWPCPKHCYPWDPASECKPCPCQG